MAFARDVYTATALQTDFTITFSYQADADVKVFVAGVLQTITTDYTFFNATTIRLVVGAPENDKVVLQRSTSQSTRSVTFVAGTLAKSDLNNAAIQAFFMAQEAIDIANIKLGKATDEIFDALSVRIKNVAEPTSDQDAATKNYADNLAIGVLGSPISIANGGTASATAAAARTALGVKIGTDVRSFADAAALGTANVFTKSQTWKQGADVVAAAALLVNIDGNLFDVTGATTITSLATKGIGTTITLQFDSTPTITHHATNLILPGGVNIVAAAGDIGVFYEYGSGTWRCTSYTKATGKAIVLPVAADLVGLVPVNNLAEKLDVSSGASNTSAAAGIPSWARRITLLFNGVSTSHASANLLVRLGNTTSTTGETSGYVSTGHILDNAGGSTAGNSTTAFYIEVLGAAQILNGRMVLDKLDTDEWVSSHMFSADTIRLSMGGGHKLMAVTPVDRVNFVWDSGGSGDAGSITILYE